MRDKKRILGILISLCMAFAMITGTALAADTAPQTEGTGPDITEPETVTEDGTAEFQINVVHTNDIHARILEDDWNQVIGLPKVKTYIDRASQGKDLSLVLDGGDTFHGQSIATLVRGESAAKALGACGYDGMAVGNHDWNYGKDRLKELENIVRENGSPQFSILAGNVVNEDKTMFLDRQYLTKEAVKDGKTLKIGVFGVIDPAIYHATAPGNVEGLEFTDMTVYAREAALELKAQGCQIVVGMAHCIDPKRLASSVDSVDLWIAGHEHTTMNETVTRPDGGTALVVETGYNLWNFGNVDIICTLDEDGNLAEDIKMTENLVDYGTGKSMDADPDVQALLDGITEDQKAVLSQPVGYAPEDLDGVWEHIRIGETTMGRAVTDAYLLATGADIAFENAGGIRDSIGKGTVTYQNVLNVAPYGNYIVTKELRGKEILEILETSLDIMKANIEANEKGDYDGWPDNSGNTLQTGGIEVRYDLSMEKGDRILSALVQGNAIQEEKAYTVAMNNFLPNDISDYPQFEGKDNLHEYQACEDALAAYLGQPENVVLEGIRRGRLIATDGKPDNSGQPDNNVRPGQGGNEEQTGSKPKPTAPVSTDTKKADAKTVSAKTGDGVNIESYLLLALMGAGGIFITLRKAASNS